MLFKHLRKTAIALGLATSAFSATSAVADDGWHPLYVGHGNHVKVGVGLGLNLGDNSTGFGLQPAVSGRFKINPQFGVLLDIPMAYGSLSVDSGGSVSRFEIGNISAALEYTIDELTSSFSRLRFGLTAPTMSRVSNGLLGLSEDAIAQGINVALATGANGLMDLWRFSPDTFALSAEFLAESGADGVYLEVAGGLAILIPTGDVGDVEMALQTRFRIGFGEDVIGFGGLTMVILPTVIGDGDGFQLGLQAGGIFKLGAARLDAFLQLNLDNPAGFSFSDDGVFGFHLAGTVPF